MVRLLLPVALGLSPVSAGGRGPSLPQIEIVAARSTLNSAERIGARRTGQLCLPAGAILWGDAAPDWTAVGEALASIMRARGLDAITSAAAADEPQPTEPRRRLSVVVSTVHLDACVPQHGLVRLVGGRKKLKVSGTITLRWRLTDPTGETTPVEREAVPVIAVAEARTLPDVVSAAITAAVPAAVADALGR